MTESSAGEAHSLGGSEASTPEFWFERALNSVHVIDDARLALPLAHCMVERIGEVLSRRPVAVITTSTGRTLRPAYAVLRDAYRSAVDWARVVCVQMDEYAGVGSADPRSAASELLREFVEPLGIGRLMRFYDAAGTAQCSPAELEREVYALGGLDCAIHGVGRNGHIGFNEPAAAEETATRVVSLADSTRLANGVAFEQGVTLGLGILRQARVSVVVLRGAEKRDAAKALLFDPAGPRNPVATLRSCPRVSVYLDQQAAPTQLSGSQRLRQRYFS